MQKLLVTGATGFLGSWLTKALIAQGYQVRILARKSSDLNLLGDLPVEKFIGDVTDTASLEAAVKNVDSIFHLAGLIGYTRQEYANMFHVNVTGTYNVLQAAKNHKIRRLIHMSSVVAIGASYDDRNILDENSPYTIQHLKLGYFETKRQAEALVKQACDDNEIDAVILNPSTIYGRGDFYKTSRKIQLKVARGKFPFYTGGGVSVVHVEDVINAIIQAWKTGKKGERYILSGDNLTIRQLFEIIALEAKVKPPNILLPKPLLFGLGYIGNGLELLNRKGPINIENAWTSTLFHWFSSDKAQRELGFKPRPASEAIADSISWLRTNNSLI